MSQKVNLKLTERHIQLYKLLRSRKLGSSCHDLLPEEKMLLNHDGWVEFCFEFHKWNGDLAEFNPNYPIIQDYACLDFLEFLINNVNEENKYKVPSIEYEKRINMEQVNHPSHYNQGKFEVIEIIEDQQPNFHLGNAIKYICRAGKKNKEKTIEDLQKAIWYINRYIEIQKPKTEVRRPNDMNERTQ
jgi:Protein of unknwon function (DUF3310)